MPVALSNFKGFTQWSVLPSLDMQHSLAAISVFDENCNAYNQAKDQ
jgi:hypothetical protein